MENTWGLSHSGVFARDFDKTIKYYRSLGLAPDLGRTQEPFSAADKTITTVFGKVRHEERDPLKPYFLQLLYIGDLELEVLHAPVERPQGEALAYGEGVNHVCFNVPDIDAETDKLTKKGFPLVLDFRRNGQRLEDYLDTREFGNILVSFRTPQTEEMKAKKAGYGIVNWKFHGHGAVVRDVDKTAKYYESMGIATIQAQTIGDLEVYGKASKDTIKAKTRNVQIGPVAYEFIQPLEGQDIYRESLDRRGEGIIDLTFTVDDLEKETAKLVKKGVPVVFSGRTQTGRGFAYFDTRKDGGDIMIKLAQY